MTAACGAFVVLALVPAGPMAEPPRAAAAPAAAPAAPEPPATDAQPPWAELDWDRSPEAEGCISREELVRETEGVLRRAAFAGDGPAALRVHGSIGRDERGRWAATLSLETADGRGLGTRDLSSDADNCRALDESLSVVLSLMVDVDRTRLEAASPPPSPSAPAPPPLPPSLLAPSVEAGAEPPPTPRWGWEIAAGGALGSGWLPGQAVGLQAGVSGRPPRLPPVDVYGSLWLASAQGNGFVAKLQAWVAGVATCPISRASAGFEIEACVGGEGGQYSARAPGMPLPEQTGPLVELIAGPRLRAPLGGGWQARLGVYAVVAAIRTRLVVTVADREEQIFESTPLSPRVGLDLAWGTTP